MDDQSILALIRTGKNDLAINKLYSLYPAIRKMIRARGGTNTDAEDVFQEALIILLRKAADPNFRLTAQLSTWLYSVARFVWIDQLRKRRSNVSVDMSDQADPAAAADQGMSANQADIAEALEYESRIRLAERALDDLKDRCRELLLLFYQRQLSLAAIASKMGYGTENSAKNQKYKCLEAARTRLKELQQQAQTL
jgi:RNA polymerase sigma factor (sigma-70 family)